MTSPLQITPIKIAADEYPDRLAFDDGKVQITYGQLPDKLEASPVMRIAGLQPGDHVAWCPQNDWDGFLTFWALQQLGCVACPISHRFPDAQRQQIVKYLDAKWLPDLTADQRLKREQVPGSSGSAGNDRAQFWQHRDSQGGGSHDGGSCRQRKRRGGEHAIGSGRSVALVSAVISRERFVDSGSLRGGWSDGGLLAGWFCS